MTTRRDVIRGLRNGLIGAGLVLALVALGFTLLAAGRPLLGTTLGLDNALSIGLLLGSAVALGYLGLGGVLFLAGLLLRADPRWLTRDAWLAAPVLAVLAAAAFGFASGVGEYADRPLTRAGSVSLDVEGPDIGRVQVSGQAQCILEEGIHLAVHAGTGEGSALLAPDGRQVRIQFGLVGGSTPRLALDIGSASAADARSPAPLLHLVPGATRHGGRLEFAGLAPLDSATGAPAEMQAWSGNLAWQCSF